jgi:hypothetical protein
MESYRSHQFFVEAGDTIKKTQNCFSWGGAVILCNVSEVALNRDYRRWRRIKQIICTYVDYFLICI